MASSPTVLVIDDSPLMREVAELVLSEAGFQVTAVANGVSAVCSFDPDRHDLVLCDVCMEGMDGFEVCTRLRGKCLDTPIIMLTSLDDTDSVHRAYEAGATDFVVKPCTWEILIPRLRYLHRAAAAFRGLRAAEAEARRNAHFDALTGLPNRVLFRQHTDQAIKRAGRSGETLAVLYLDLDHFKKINDSFGHPAGDTFLFRVSDRVRDALRDNDVMGRVDEIAKVARLGGDEFAVLLTDLRDGNDAARVAERILSSLRRPIALRGQEVFPGCSIGIAVHPGDGDDVDTLLKHADAAMYHAKSSGRNRFAYFSLDMTQQARERLALESALRRAIERGELRVHYQAQVDAASGKTLGCEALIRWERPGTGLVSPGQFIPLAEETGLVVPMGAWILRKACHQAMAWRCAGLELTMAVNVSSRQLRSPDTFVQLVRDVLRDTELPPHLLELEITESALVADPQEAKALLGELRGLGVQIALDDFGTGYSSLSYLHEFDFDVLKIDGIFVRELLGNPRDAAIVRATLDIARSLGMQTVAEWVEEPAQLEQLRAMGCDRVQGWLTGRPLPAPAFVAQLYAPV